ncbi:MAG: hypothetical protein IID18_04325, partial [Nitrospinae bacterium]|nr:hypothetical protein [Nitrospinota bacterium]
MTLLIVTAIVLLAFLGTPLYAVIGLGALVSFHTPDINPAAGVLLDISLPALGIGVEEEPEAVESVAVVDSVDVPIEDEIVDEVP